LSYFVTHFEEQPNSLYRNLGPNGFEDVSWVSGLGQPGYPYVAWGTSFFDMDNDTWLDLLVANGHVYPQVDTLDTGPRYREPLLLHRNNRDGTFDDVSKESGLADLPLQSRRGAAFGDIFNDGNIDVLLLNVGATPSLLKNTNADGFHRILFKLIGTKSNRAAIGARVTIVSAGITQISEVRGGESYLSQNDLRVHFGLGTAKIIESVQIRWPNGDVETLHNVAADAICTVIEGQGIRDIKPLPAPVDKISNTGR
jgi:Trp operon repressor